MKALVLSGGGSLGSYEMGAIKALLEEGERFSLVTGTSIGALIASMLASGQFDKCLSLWESIDIDDVMKNGFSLSRDFFEEARSVQTGKILAFAKSYISHRGADIQPFKDLMDRTIDYAAISSSATKIGIVVTSYPSLKEVDLTLNGLDSEDIRDYLLATSACFPLFPVHSFKGRKYVDGGFTNNLPIDLAIKMGASDIVAISLPAIPKVPQNVELTRLPFVRLIAPRHDIGTIMDFSRKRLGENMLLGYLDARKSYKRNRGYDYYFLIKERDYSLSERFSYALFKKEPGSIDAVNRSLGLEEGKRHAAMEYFVSTLELAAKALNVPPLKEYGIREMEYLIHTGLEESVPPGEDGSSFKEKRLSPKSLKKFLFAAYGAKRHRKKSLFHKDLLKNSPEANALIALLGIIFRQKID